MLAGRLTVWVAYKDGHSGVGQTDLVVPSDRFDILLDAARPCLRKAWMPRVRATHMHLIAERLTPRSQAPLGLFDSPAQNERARAVADLEAGGQRPPRPVRPPQRRHAAAGGHLSRHGQCV